MSAATHLPPPDFYTWGFSGAPVQIHLRLEVVSRIRTQIQNAEKSTGVLSGCGLLTGDTSKPGITRILAFQPLQALDAASVEAATRRTSAAVVGFYRTAPMGSTALPDEDRALAARSFRHPTSVFLVIETGKTGIGEARFCFWSDDELFDWPVMLFPFDAEELGIKEWRRRANAGPETLQSSRALIQVVSPPREGPECAPQPGPPLPDVPAHHWQASIAPEPVAQQRKLVGRKWLAPTLTLAAIALLLGGASLYFRSASKVPVAQRAAAPRAEERTPLGLTVGRRGNDLLVSWNGNAPVISRATFGMLLIRSSTVSRDVPLSVEELRAGSVVYASPVDDVRFQLNVVAGGEVAREFVTVLLPGSPGGRATQASSQSGNSNAGAPTPPPVSKAPAPTREFRPFEAGESRAAAAAPPQRIEEPPAEHGAAPVNAASLSLLNQQPVSMPLPLPLPADVADKGIPKSVSPSPRSEAHPPVATHQVIPAVPLLLRGRLLNAAVVSVKVSVDASGNVVQAEAAATHGVHLLLRDAAVQAARKWKFQPAQVNGRPVPAEADLQFRFAASSAR